VARRRSHRCLPVSVGECGQSESCAGWAEVSVIVGPEQERGLAGLRWWETRRGRAKHRRHSRPRNLHGMVSEASQGECR
jgi:hypothetical protein